MGAGHHTGFISGFFRTNGLQSEVGELGVNLLGDWGSCWAHGRMAPRTRRFGWIFAEFDLLICLFVVVTCWFLHFLNLRSARCWSLLLFHCSPKNLCQHSGWFTVSFQNLYGRSCRWWGVHWYFFRILTSLNHNRWLRYSRPYYIPRVRNSPAKQRLSGWSLFNLWVSGNESLFHSTHGSIKLKPQTNYRLFCWGCRCFGRAPSECNLLKIKGLPCCKLSHHVTMPQPFLRQHVWAQWWGRRWEMLWCWLWKTAKSLWKKKSRIL